MGLNLKQQRFIDEYLIDGNATAAYRRAGYKAKGRSAENSASRLLGSVGVAKEIVRRQSLVTAPTEVTAERVISEIASIAFNPSCQDKDRLTALGMLAKRLGLDHPDTAEKQAEVIELRLVRGGGDG